MAPEQRNARLVLLVIVALVVAVMVVVWEEAAKSPALGRLESVGSPRLSYEGQEALVNKAIVRLDQAHRAMRADLLGGEENLRRAKAQSSPALPRASE